jgi:hypothetical protein
MAYYNPEAILTDAQKAPCTFELAVPGLAPLNNGSAIENGTKLDLPLWMAEMLAVSRPAGPSSTSLASLDMPQALGQRVMNALRADPRSVDIRAQAQSFYGLAERMLDLFEEEEMVEVLLDVRPVSSLFRNTLANDPSTDFQEAGLRNRGQGAEYTDGAARWRQQRLHEGIRRN